MGSLTLSVPVSFQHPLLLTKHIQNKTFGKEKMRIDQTKLTAED